MHSSQPALSVMIVDDVADLRSLYKFVLEDSGRFVVVAQAGTGEEAIALAARHHPDLVLLDLAMPEMHGAEALPAILDVSPTSRVVVLSGFAEPVMGPILRAAGAAGYLEKGITPLTLVAELTRLTQGALI